MCTSVTFGPAHMHLTLDFIGRKEGQERFGASVVPSPRGNEFCLPYLAQPEDRLAALSRSYARARGLATRDIKISRLTTM